MGALIGDHCFVLQDQLVLYKGLLQKRLMLKLCGTDGMSSKVFGGSGLSLVGGWAGST